MLGLNFNKTLQAKEMKPSLENKIKLTGFKCSGPCRIFISLRLRTLKGFSYIFDPSEFLFGQIAGKVGAELMGFVAGKGVSYHNKALETNLWIDVFVFIFFVFPNFRVFRVCVFLFCFVNGFFKIKNVCLGELVKCWDGKMG